MWVQGVGETFVLSAQFYIKSCIKSSEITGVKPQITDVVNSKNLLYLHQKDNLQTESTQTKT